MPQQQNLFFKDVYSANATSITFTQTVEEAKQHTHIHPEFKNEFRMSTDSFWNKRIELNQIKEISRLRKASLEMEENKPTVT